MSEVAGPRRLRELLGVLALSSDLDPTSILTRIIEASVKLVDARYGALGVLDETGTRLSQFITVGIDDVRMASVRPAPGRNASGIHRWPPGALPRLAAGRSVPAPARRTPA